jgi:hypothetical protein
VPYNTKTYKALVDENIHKIQISALKMEVQDRTPPFFDRLKVSDIHSDVG